MPPYYRQLVREKCALWIAKRAQPTSIFEKQTELCEIVQVLAALPPCKYTGEDHHQLKEEMDSLAMRNMKRVAHFHDTLAADKILPSTAADCWASSSTGTAS